MAGFAHAVQPELSKIPGFYLLRVFADSMHTVDMGVSPHIVGNIVWELTSTTIYGTDSRAKRLERMYHEYKQYCRDTGVQVISTIWKAEKLNKSSAQHFPFMKSKANECKHMVPYVYRAACVHNSGSPHDEWRAACAWGLVEYYDVIGTKSRYLSMVEVARLQHAIDVCLSCYYALHAEAKATGDARPAVCVFAFQKTSCVSLRGPYLQTFTNKTHTSNRTATIKLFSGRQQATGGSGRQRKATGGISGRQGRQREATEGNGDNGSGGAASDLAAATAEDHGWHVVPKHHLWCHIGDTVAVQINPSHCTCYADEDIVGHLAKTGRKCHRFAVTRATNTKFIIPHPPKLKGFKG